MKWVSLMLWLGADPYALGTDEYREEWDPEDGASAIYYAVMYGHYEVLELRQLKLDPTHPEFLQIFHSAHEGRGIEVLSKLSEQGLNPNDRENGGCSGISQILSGLEWEFPSFGRSLDPPKDKNRGLNPPEAPRKMKVVHLLAKYGGRWVPEGREEINSIRRTLIRMKPDYTAELIWIMAKHGACTQESAVELLRTPATREVIGTYISEIDGLVEKLPEQLDRDPPPPPPVVFGFDSQGG